MMRKRCSTPMAVFLIASILFCGAQPGLLEAQSTPTMRVMVHNDTQKRALPPKSEIWIRGVGSWWLQKATEFGADFKEAPIRKVGEMDHLFIYPDGRGTRKEITIPYKLTGEMCVNACVRDALDISISDSEVEVFGLPFKAATGQLEKKFER